jgi:hypothetical protein
MSLMLGLIDWALYKTVTEYPLLYTYI